jgi:hypothetical protein
MLKYKDNILLCPKKRKANHFEDSKESPIYSKIAINEILSFSCRIYFTTML